MDEGLVGRWEAGRAAYAAQFRVSLNEAEEQLRVLLGDQMAENAILAAGGGWSDASLTPREKSLLVVASLITQGGVEARLHGHVRWALDHGASPVELEALVSLLAVYVGYAKASVGMEVVRDEISSYVPTGPTS